MNACYLVKDGTLEKCNTVLHRSMLYGDGFFESMRLYQGKIMLKALHEERIKRSAALLQLPLGNFSGLDQVEEALNIYKDYTHLRLRLLILRSGTGFYLPEDQLADIYLTVQETDSFYRLNEKGFHCISYRDQTKAAGKYSVLKSTSALLYVMASIRVKEAGAQEAIIYNASGNIAEGSSTNIFLYRNGSIQTPALSEGCIDGVFRRFLLQTANEAGYKTEEGILTEEDALSADEVWFTSSTRGLLWAEKLGNTSYTNSKAKELFSVLMKALI